MYKLNNRRCSTATELPSVLARMQTGSCRPAPSLIATLVLRRLLQAVTMIVVVTSLEPLMAQPFDDALPAPQLPGAAGTVTFVDDEPEPELAPNPDAAAADSPAIAEAEPDQAEPDADEAAEGKKAGNSDKNKRKETPNNSKTPVPDAATSTDDAPISPPPAATNRPATKPTPDRSPTTVPPVTVPSPVKSKPNAAKQTPSALEQEFHQMEAALTELQKTDPRRAAVIANSLRNIMRSLKAQATGKPPVGPRPVPSRTAGPSRSGIRPPTTRPTPKPDQSPLHQAETLIQQIAKLGGEDQAAPYKQRLEAIRKGLSGGEYQINRSPQAEIHQVSLQNGTTLPKRFRTTGNQYRLGYAEVHVNYTAAPIILILQANEPVLWNVVSDKDAEIQAVVFESSVPQELRGLQRPLVLHTRTAEEWGLITQNANATSRGALLAGGTPLTVLRQQTYDGNPIEIGPNNKTWLKAFLEPRTTQLISETQAARRALQLERVRDLQFATTFVPNGTRSTRTGTPPSSIRGQFNVMGPIANTLRPLPHPQLRQMISIPPAEDADADANNKPAPMFGLDANGRLVVVPHDNRRDRLDRVPPSHKIRGSNQRFRAMTFDATNRRLILAANLGSTTELVSFHVDRGEWTKLGSVSGAAIALSYLSDAKQLRGVVVSLGSTQTARQAQLITWDTHGKQIGQIQLQEPLAPRPQIRSGYSHYGSVWDQSFPQLLDVDGLAVFVGTPFVRQVASMPPRIQIIEPESGQTLYAGPLQVNDGEVDERQIASAANTHAFHRNSILGDIQRQIADLRQQLASAPQGKTRTALIARQKQALATLAGQPVKHEDAHLYVVGRYATSKPITVRVTDTGGPVALVLSGHQAVQWNVEAVEGAQIARIIATGNQQQKVLKHPAGTKVEHLHGKQGITIYDPRTARHDREMRGRLQELTGLSPMGISATHQSQYTEIRVGALEGPFRLQWVQRQLTELLAEAKHHWGNSPEQILSNKRFVALHRGTMPNLGAKQAGAQRTGRESQFWGEFSVAGPLIGDMQPLSQTAQYCVHDAKQDILYLSSHTQLTVFHPQTKQSDRVNLAAQDRRMGQVTGLAFDTRRNRLIVNAHSQMASYDPKTKKLAALRHTLNGGYEASLAYSHEDDSLYTLAFNDHRNSLTHLIRYNAHGAQVRSLPLAKPIYQTRYGSSNTVQLIDFGSGMLAAIAYQASSRYRIVNGRNTRVPPQGHIYIFDKATGESVYQSTITPTIQRRELTEVELSELWQKLGKPQAANLDKLLWQLASGHEQTVGFIANQLAHDQKRPAAELDLPKLIEQLDDHRFTVRDEAFRAIQDAGSRIQSDLAEFLTKDVSTEVRERVQSILFAWKHGEPQNDRERQHVRAMEVLGRLNSPDAVALLVRSSQDASNGLLQATAQQMLTRLGKLPDRSPAWKIQQGLFVPRR